MSYWFDVFDEYSYILKDDDIMRKLLFPYGNTCGVQKEEAEDLHIISEAAGMHNDPTALAGMLMGIIFPGDEVSYKRLAMMKPFKYNASDDYAELTKCFNNIVIPIIRKLTKSCSNIGGENYLLAVEHLYKYNIETHKRYITDDKYVPEVISILTAIHEHTSEVGCKLSRRLIEYYADDVDTHKAMTCMVLHHVRNIQLYYAYMAMNLLVSSDIDDMKRMHILICEYGRRRIFSIYNSVELIKRNEYPHIDISDQYTSSLYEDLNTLPTPFGSVDINDDPVMDISTALKKELSDMDATFDYYFNLITNMYSPADHNFGLVFDEVISFQ